MTQESIQSLKKDIYDLWFSGEPGLFDGKSLKSLAEDETSVDAEGGKDQQADQADYLACLKLMNEKLSELEAAVKASKYSGEDLPDVTKIEADINKFDASKTVHDNSRKSGDEGQEWRDFDDFQAEEMRTILDMRNVLSLIHNV